MNKEEAIECLRHGWEMDRLAQGYIVNAPPRVEGRWLAEKIMQLLLCREAAKPCGTCRECRHVAERTHPDVFWIEPQKRSRAISVGQVRDLQSSINQTSFGGGWKICVINAADRMTDQAANAFLKTLEEPPGRSLFLLLTDSPQALLSTIISRCQRLTILSEEPPLQEEWAAALLEILSDPTRGSAVGWMSKAARLSRLLGEVKDFASREIGEETDASPVEGDEEDDTLEARIHARYLEYRLGILRFLQAWHRDVLLLAGGGDPALLTHSRQAARLQAEAERLDLHRALSHIRELEEMNMRLARNMPEEFVIGYAFRRMA